MKYRTTEKKTNEKKECRFLFRCFIDAAALRINVLLLLLLLCTSAKRRFSIIPREMILMWFCFEAFSKRTSRNKKPNEMRWRASLRREDFEKMIGNKIFVASGNMHTQPENEERTTEKGRLNEGMRMSERDLNPT